MPDPDVIERVAGADALTETERLRLAERVQWEGSPLKHEISEDQLERLLGIGEMIIDALEELHEAVQALDQRMTEIRQHGVRLRL